MQKNDFHILFGYDYIDTTGFKPVRVFVKCKLIFKTFDEIDSYINNIRKFYNPNDIKLEYNKKLSKILKFKPYHLQIVGADNKESLDD